MDRTQFIEQQVQAAEETFSLTSGEERARERFRQLAVDTYDFLVSVGTTAQWVFTPSAVSAFNVLYSASSWNQRDGRNIELPSTLVQRWENWNREYFAIR